MSSGPHFPGGRFDYEKWAISDGFPAETDNEQGAEQDREAGRGQLGWTDAGESGHVVNVYGASNSGVSDGDLPLRGSIDELGGGLFGGPGADLFGTRYEDPGDPLPAPANPISPATGSFVSPFSREPERGGPPSLSMFSSASGGYDSQSSIRPISAPIPAEPSRDSGSLVRPYTRTGGRTRPDYDLAIEALVETSERGRHEEAAALPEHRSICGLCVETRSVAEVAAYLRLPLGVVRVLIGDMAGLGLVMIHQSGLLAGDRPSLAFLERVLSGLRKL